MTIGGYCLATCLMAALIGGAVWGLLEIAPRLGYRLDPANNLTHAAVHVAVIFVAFSVSIGISDPLWLWMRARMSGDGRSESYTHLRHRNRPLDN